MISALTCTLLLAILLVTGGCKSAQHVGKISVMHGCMVEIQSMGNEQGERQDDSIKIDQNCEVTLEAKDAPKDNKQ